jgi:hypothetical protein
MVKVSPRRAFWTSTGLLLTALVALLVATPAADAGRNGTSGYRYHVTNFSYDAKGQLTGGRFKGLCVPNVNAAWQGTVETGSADVADLGSLGDGSLFIDKNHDASGSIDATLKTTSTLSDAYYRMTTACDEDGNETAYTMKVCPGTLDSTEQALVRISPGSGDGVNLSWHLTNEKGKGHLVPDAFKCGVRYTFPDGRCRTKAPLSKFTGEKVTLPFKCGLFATTTPPAGTDYTQYESTAQAKGSLTLKRTKKY